MRPVLRYTSVETIVGRLWLAYDERGICFTMLAASEGAFVQHCRQALGRAPQGDPEPPRELMEAVEARLREDAALPFNLDGLTPFQRSVLEAVAAIPRGEARSYGQIADAVGHPGAARAVGEVMRTNRIPVLIPCHRVVRAGGAIGRYTPDPAIKERLLEAEGALARLSPLRPDRRRGLSPADSP